MLGGTRITYLGHSTFRFTTAGGEQILIDPFLTDNPQTPDDLKRVDDLDTIQVGGIKVTATNAFHSSSIALDDGSLIYGGEPLGYVIEFESGFKLYHAGDTCVFGDMRLIGELYGPDLALLPIGNQVVMSPYEAAHAARLLNVGHVVPMHYGTFPFVPGTA